MTRDEFSTWASDLTARFPQTGEWVRALPAETRNVWFSDVFEALELRDCLAVNLLLMKGGEIEAWQRERLPSIFIKRCSELRYAMEQAKISQAVKNEIGSCGGRPGVQSVMGIAWEQVMTARDRYRKDNQGRTMTTDDTATLVAKIMSRVDTEDDSGPRYRCLPCRDSGWVSYRDSRERYTVGHCSCGRGMENRDLWIKKFRRSIGVAPSMSVSEWDVA